VQDAADAVSSLQVKVAGVSVAVKANEALVLDVAEAGALVTVVSGAVAAAASPGQSPTRGTMSAAITTTRRRVDAPPNLGVDCCLPIVTTAPHLDRNNEVRLADHRLPYWPPLE
jgi:hypothetical protein